MKTVRIVSLTGLAIILTMCSPVREQQRSLSQLDRRARDIKSYAQQNGYSTRYCFMLDLSLESGLKRFFVYDFTNKSVVLSGLVSHGDCYQDLSRTARFSNTPGGGCSSIGLYKVGRAYYGQYGKSYKLHGLQHSNSNAFKRAIVMHGNSFVPEEETYPKPICNSSGCPMVAFSFLRKLSSIIDHSSRPVLLYVYETQANPVKAILRPWWKQERFD